MITEQVADHGLVFDPINGDVATLVMASLPGSTTRLLRVELLDREVAELRQNLEVGVTWPSIPTLNHREGHILDCGNDYIDLHQWFEI